LEQLVENPDDLDCTIRRAYAYENQMCYREAEVTWQEALSICERDSLHEREAVLAMKKISDLCCAQGKYREATLMLCLHIARLRRLRASPKILPVTEAGAT